jgi:hypothetical protein
VARSNKSANYNEMRPQVSRAKTLKRTPFNEDIITLLNDSVPTTLLENPDQIVPHESIPNKVKDAIINGFGEKYFYDKEWSLLEVKKLKRVITYPRENLTNSIAQICSPNCTIKDTCPYDIIGEAPVGSRCPIELKLAQLLTDEYNLAVSERHNIAVEDLESDIVYYNLIRGLVEADIVDNRLNSAIGRDGFTQDVPSAVNSETGEVFFKQEESVAIRIKDRVNGRKDKLYQQLIASPEMIAKYKIKSEGDIMNRLLDAVEQLEKAATTTKSIDVNKEIINDN